VKSECVSYLFSETGVSLSSTLLHNMQCFFRQAQLSVSSWLQKNGTQNFQTWSKLVGQK